MQEFGDLFVCRIYNHSVYTGIWCSICKPAYTTVLYKWGYVLNFESGYVFIPKAHICFNMVESDL